MNRLILVLALLWPVSLLADFQAGFDAYNSGDYATAYREWLPLAEQGDAKAQFNIGALYDFGEGVLKDDAVAVQWYRLAAAQGDVEAQFNLALMYQYGEGVPQDYMQAYAWFNIAAAQGNKNAVNNRDVIQRRMTPAQVAEGEKLSRELFEKLKK